ncbi:hypothetical protein F511_45138 [Dorcoceras hygrometricum]|uniref:Uncharacterized protein n=1 Tax=Dorcoceras hygrometricum TaxID=472368 RepID=A0A2Z6ZWY9_9LAMI|nr:hypothetical protein F511_45138 [Dorcoceras hygrometricum]
MSRARYVARWPRDGRSHVARWPRDTSDGGRAIALRVAKTMGGASSLAGVEWRTRCAPVAHHSRVLAVQLRLCWPAAAQVAMKAGRTGGRMQMVARRWPDAGRTMARDCRGPLAA